MSVGHAIVVDRVYEQRSPFHGHRVLVDRIWPRGLSRSAAELDEWCKAIAPSTQLRQWYRHAPSRFPEFRRRYLAELENPAHAADVSQLRSMALQQDLTLLTASKDINISHALVLAEHLRSAAGRKAANGHSAPQQSIARIENCT